MKTAHNQSNLNIYRTSISNRITPRDHQSICGPYPFIVKTSGAM